MTKIFFLGEEAIIREEFLGFTKIDDMSAKGISEVILDRCKEYGLDMSKLLGQGYDGCSAMAGHISGVQARIKESYPKAIFTHCAAHRLNLVVQKLSSVPQIRNTIGTIKSLIHFYRSSPLRRNLVGSCPYLCETRWSSKYEAIRKFSSSFPEYFKHLNQLSQSGNSQTRQTAFQLAAACDSPTFIVCLLIIAEYSKILEPLTNVLQSVEMNIVEVQTMMGELLQFLKIQRSDAENVFKDIFKDVIEMCKLCDIEMRTPRQCSRQQHRSNPEIRDPESYFRITIFIPYLAALILELEERFKIDDSPHMNLMLLCPKTLRNVSKEEFLSKMKITEKFYDIQDLYVQSKVWYEAAKNYETKAIIDLASNLSAYPAIRRGLQILLILPITTCAIERTFSSLRRVKDWSRSTMTDQRLSSLCMLSVHREKVEQNKEEFVEKIIELFGSNKRRLQFN